MKFQARLKKGSFNNMDQTWHRDGTVTITLHDRKAKKHATARVKDLYGPNEEEVDIETGSPRT